MAETKTQNTPTESSQAVAPRPEYSPSRDWFGLSPFSAGPFTMMRRLSEEMDRAFASAFGQGRTGEWGAWSPPVDVRRDNGDLDISAELPGLGKDDVKVECSDDGITIEGEKKREIEKDEGGVHRSERSYGHFYRLIPLPEGAEPEKAKAEFKDGVLHVRVPVSETARTQRRQIPIST